MACMKNTANQASEALGHAIMVARETEKITEPDSAAARAADEQMRLAAMAALADHVAVSLRDAGFRRSVSERARAIVMARKWCNRDCVLIVTRKRANLGDALDARCGVAERTQYIDLHKAALAMWGEINKSLGRPEPVKI